MMLDAVDIAFVLIKRDISRMIVAEEHRALLRRTFGPTAAASSRLDASRIDGPSAPGVGPRMGRMGEELPQGLAMRRMPLQLPSGRPVRWAKRQLDLMLPQEL